MKTSVYQASLAHRAIGATGSLAMIAIAFVGTVPTYRVAPAILIPVLWGIYLLRGVLNLNPFRYALLTSALFLHMLGAFGYYQKSPLPFSFDIFVHYYFALLGTVVLYRALEANFPSIRPWHLAIMTFLFMMGLAALHEIMEYCSYLLLGEERGMLKPTTSYFFDTQRDLTNNLLGAITGIAVLAIHRASTTKLRSP